MLSQEVVTGNGVTKIVLAGNEAELAEGVAAAMGELSLPAPDIDKPTVAVKSRKNRKQAK